ncbi:MAG: peptide deformylase [Bacteriovoracaceae bacterium]|nr:peptide deformylase [Bacteriovoracaceae bacterium]
MNGNTILDNYKCEGDTLDILEYPHPCLKKKAVSVEKFDSKLELLCKNMLYTMYQAPGIGLAAPQVGESIRMFVLDVDYTREKVTCAEGVEKVRLANHNPQIFINPRISNREGEICIEEGCLSLMGIYEEVRRAENITVQYQDLQGNEHTIDASGILSVCIQHENDHLDGIVFIDRLSLLKKNILVKKLIKAKKNKNNE